MPVMEKMLENPLDSKEIKSVNAEGKHPEYSLEGLMLKLKPPDEKSRLIGKDPDAGKD